MCLYHPSVRAGVASSRLGQWGGGTGRDGLVAAQLWLGPGGGGRSGSRVEVCPTAGPQSRGIGSCGHLSGPCVRDWSLITGREGLKLGKLRVQTQPPPKTVKRKGVAQPTGHQLLSVSLH